MDSKAARGHLRLAEGLIETAKIGDAASEYEIRNAFSRAYYALFHACCGYLFAQGVANVRVLIKDHGKLHAEMDRGMGRPFGRFMRDCYELRRNSDYRAEWAVPPFYSCVEKLKHARTQCYFVVATAKRLIP